ncbi:flagellar protein FlgN [Rheinheimera sp. D18]|uniref:flagellar protein FlgN n=1 Tax=Rheinheimera sp. D18 TaxID=2545632 RepID=UPI0010507EAD|nr:flagellar protein FlgN [Rheinheimera sp. D18]QBL09924.1 flagellar protein FlgN [Rheinheimera sp. D18]
MTLAVDSVTTLLTKQHQHLDELMLLLRQELAALASRNINELEQISSAKYALLQQLEATDVELANITDLEQYKQQDWFKLEVEGLEQKLELCKQHNSVNQQTLEQSQLTLARFKTEILSSRGKSGLTYTNKGVPSVDSKGKGVKA